MAKRHTITGRGREKGKQAESEFSQLADAIMRVPDRLVRRLDIIPNESITQGDITVTTEFNGRHFPTLVIERLDGQAQQSLRIWMTPDQMLSLARNLLAVGFKAAAHLKKSGQK